MTGPVCLSDTDSSDDSTYSSQYQSDANSTPTTRQSGGSRDDNDNDDYEELLFGKLGFCNLQGDPINSLSWAE